MIVAMLCLAFCPAGFALGADDQHTLIKSLGSVPLAKIRPGKPAPAIGPGTATQENCPGQTATPLFTDSDGSEAREHDPFAQSLHWPGVIETAKSLN
jgi:hypothetical protein